MQSMIESSPERAEATPSGMIAAAVVFFALAAYLLFAALLVFVGVLSFTTAAWLLGGLETMGPVIYVLFAAFAALIGWGLVRRQPWARHLATIVAGVVFVLAIPIISGAVAYSSIAVIAREGLKIIVCVVLFRYLEFSSQ